MEQPPSPERLQELDEQRKSRELLEKAREELGRTSSQEPKKRDIDERWPDNVPVWKPDEKGDLKKVA